MKAMRRKEEYIGLLMEMRVLRGVYGVILYANIQPEHHLSIHNEPYTSMRRKPQRKPVSHLINHTGSHSSGQTVIWPAVWGCCDIIIARVSLRAEK